MTKFADDLYAKVSTIDDPSGDLRDYIDGLGDMFAEVETLAREDDGPVWQESLAHALTSRSGAARDWLALGAYTSLTDDKVTTYKGGQTLRIDVTANNASPSGVLSPNLPAKPGRKYRLRTMAKGTPGDTLQPAIVFFSAINGGGTNQEFDGSAITFDGSWQESEMEAVAPSWANYAYAYLMNSPTVVGRRYWLAGSEFNVQSLSPAPHIPWSKITDPELANSPAMLLWLAQLAGVKVPVGLGSEDMRTFIEAAESRRRGTISYMVEVAQRLLTGTKTVYTHERVSSAYTLSIATKASETPDSTAVLNALLANKPAGIVMTYVTTTGVIWDTPTHQWDQATTTTWDSSLSVVP